MVPRYLGLARLHPLCGADEVLGFEQRVAEDVRVGGHGDELGEGHRVPDAVEEGGVVDLGGGVSMWVSGVGCGCGPGGGGVCC